MAKHVNFRTGNYDGAGLVNKDDAKDGALIVASGANGVRIYEKVSTVNENDDPKEIGTNPSSITADGNITAGGYLYSGSIKYGGVDKELNTLYGASLSVSDASGSSDTSITLKSGSSDDLNSVSITKVKKAYQDESGNNIKASYGASLLGVRDSIILLNKNGGNLSNITVDYVAHATNTLNVLSKSGSYMALASALLEMVYPVGSIYMSANNASPANFLGGTWVAWGSGKVPVGVNTGVSEFNTVEKTGGSITNDYSVPLLAHTHSYQKAASSTGKTAITIDHLPSHNHGGTTTSSSTTIEWTESYRRLEDGNPIARGAAEGETLTNMEIDTTWGPEQNSADWRSIERSTTKVHHKSVHNHTTTINSQGGGAGHDHSISTTTTNTGSQGVNSPTITASTLQPYITCYMWKRTA